MGGKVHLFAMKTECQEGMIVYIYNSLVILQW